jgi:signal transduction histidine kinase
MTAELSSPPLYEMGLEAALQALGRQFHKQHGIKFTYLSDGKKIVLAEQAKITLFQCVREILANVWKHSAASTVTFSATQAEGEVRISVQDNGKGFLFKDFASLVTSDSFGLFSVNERMKNIGGHIEISSTPGPTLVTLSAPAC